MKGWVHKLGLIGISIILILMGSSQSFADDGTKDIVLKVAFPQAAGVNEVYEDGTYGGFTYDWLYEISKYTGWKYEFYNGEATEILDDMILGEYDIMGGMLYYEGYEKMFCYPQYIMGQNYSLLMYSQADSSVKSFDYATLNGKRIGVLKKAVGKIERLEKFLDFNNLKCELVYYEDIMAYESCLDAGEVDLFYGSDVYLKDNYNVAAKIEADPYYLVTALKRPDLCEELSEAMSAIYSANPNFAKELYFKYFPESYINSISFTQQEIDFISTANPIKIAVLNERYPLFYHVDHKERGIIPAFIQLLSARTGLSFEYVCAESYEDQLALVQAGKADIVGGFMNGDVSADSLGLVRTKQFTSMDFVIMRNKQTELSLDSLKMAVPRMQDSKPSTPKDVIVYYKDYKECLDAVNHGEADYTLMPSAYVEEMYIEDYYTNIIFQANSNQKNELTLALKKPINITLYSILNKAVNSLSDEEQNNLVTQDLLTSQPRTVTIKTLLYTQPLLVISFVVGLVTLIAVIILIQSRAKIKEKDMELKLAKAEATSKAKSDFLSRMSHEIRTPMNAIIGMTNVSILSGEATPGLERNLKQIESSSKFLLSLLNDVLDMSKIESEKMYLDMGIFNLEDIVSRLKDMFIVQADKKQIRLSFQIEEGNQNYIGDEMRLSQVLTNLLSNACKYTERGGNVSLVVKKEAVTDNGNAMLHFCVKDTGEGIKAEELTDIFNSFEQAKTRKKDIPGTGLGLSISKSLVQLMGGELQVKSEVGAGSEFYFTISLPVSPKDTKHRNNQRVTAEPSLLAGVHILLAEDNSINAEIAMELLHMQEVIVDWAEDGQKAVDLFMSNPENYYSLILMDIRMPIMDGLAAARKIRKMNRSDAGTIPIVAMTANTFQEDRDQARAAGMTDFLPKPFDVEQLLTTIINCLSNAVNHKSN
ncbi:ATP-binding protein [Hungatella sp.]|uniref:ATP-binding protein n=1 Tax=Hungatella sp. TaxID=2613924 RepID=UPI002A83385A|nr:ATP-binding protein [Hungatella sp.]